MAASFNPEPNSAPEGDETQRKPSAGRLLREARLKAGMHLAVLSVTLKVPIRELEALEADDWDLVKGPVFYRGLASSVCRHLRADPAEILALMPPAAGQLAPVREVLGAGVSSRHFSLGSDSLFKSSPSKVVWIAALMLVLTAALLWMPGPSQWSWLDSLKASLASDVALREGTTLEDAASRSRADALDHGLSTTEVAIPLNALPVDAEPAQGADAAAATGALSSTPAAAGAVASPEPSPVPKPVASPNLEPSTAASQWVFSASDDSWLEVRNAQQAVVWSGILKSGEEARIQSPLPVSVVVGRAQVVAVRFRGQPFDLKPHTKAAVARFEVKE